MWASDSCRRRSRFSSRPRRKDAAPKPLLLILQTVQFCCLLLGTHIYNFKNSSWYPGNLKTLHILTIQIRFNQGFRIRNKKSPLPVWDIRPKILITFWKYQGLKHFGNGVKKYLSYRAKSAYQLADEPIPTTDKAAERAGELRAGRSSAERNSPLG